MSTAHAASIAAQTANLTARAAKSAATPAGFAARAADLAAQAADLAARAADLAAQAADSAANPLSLAANRVKPQFYACLLPESAFFFRLFIYSIVWEPDISLSVIEDDRHHSLARIARNAIMILSLAESEQHIFLSDNSFAASGAFVYQDRCRKSFKRRQRNRICANFRDGRTRYIRIAKTNSFGYFRFNGLNAGETYTFKPTAKNRDFAAQSFALTENLVDINFNAL